MRGPAAVLAAVLLVAGCGGEAQEDSAAEPAEPAATSAESEPSASASESASESESPEAAESESPEAAESESESESESSETATDDTEAAAAEMVITIVDFTFEVPETIAPGAEITVVNQDGVGHTVTSDEEGIFDVPVGPGEEVTFTVPDEAGEFPFHCTPHPNMTSTLVIG
ncbi:MAG: cupredoxin domain-containing protein [Ornithinimicrobium sp.]|uniref:cupredoxin domain-containing protein n=1 Tax=Ornithinimicrobium sp. TaxID=1977084 RepID=UPI003D9AC2FF